MKAVEQHYATAADLCNNQSFCERVPKEHWPQLANAGLVSARFSLDTGELYHLPPEAMLDCWYIFQPGRSVNDYI